MINKIFKSRLTAFILGAIIFGSIGVYAGTIQAKDVTYKNTTVDKALDNLYTKAETLTCSFDEYTGDTTITPSTTQQTLQTNGKLLNSDITINALPLYSGSVSVTPSTTNQTLSTNGKFLSSDITIAAIPSTYKNLTDDTTVRANNLLSGIKAYTSDGELITGTLDADCVSGIFNVDNDTTTSSGKLWLEFIPSKFYYVFDYNDFSQITFYESSLSSSFWSLAPNGNWVENTFPNYWLDFRNGKTYWKNSDLETIGSHIYYTACR